MNREMRLDEAKKCVCTDRNQQYGEPEQNFSTIAQLWQAYLQATTGCEEIELLPSISAKAVEDLERIRPYEPNLVKAAWKVFGPSYLYRQQYNEYKARRMAEEKARKKAQAEGDAYVAPLPGQMEMDELLREDAE